MMIKSLEEKLYEEWDLKSAEKILDKIFEDVSEGSTLRSMLTPEKLIACSYALGKISASYKVRLKASQLRRFYESMLNIKTLVNEIRGKDNEDELFKENVLHSVAMLKPQLARAKERQPKEVTPFFTVVNPVLDRVKGVEDYDRLCQFGEAIVAYHKYCGGRD